ncbi:MAG: peptidase domain-containing ABC transporter [Gammaproteobacteria bacterium]|nr:peptidase domain-containing ABC transporter [Gammaproteobacteria bacterium]
MTPTFGALGFKGLPRTPVILQAEAAECGLACLAMMSAYHGQIYDLSTLRAKLRASSRGATLAQLMEMAGQLKLTSRALRLELNSLGGLRLPCILHWNLDHFVVLERVRERHVEIIDPAIGRRKVAYAQVSKSFTGIALELTPAESFEKEDHRNPLRLTQFFRSVRGLVPQLARLFALSIAIQTIALLTPIYGQVVIDDVITAGTSDLLVVLAIGFGGLAMINMLIGGIRSFAVLYLGANLQFAWGARVFYHLIRLPLAYFERRSMGDVLSRFRSLSPVQNLTSTTIVEAVMDGMMAITTLGLMLVYSPSLTTIPLLALVLYIVVRTILFAPQRESANEALMESAREDSHILESLRGILAIKSFAREQIREAVWQNRAASAIRSRVHAATFHVGEQLANQAIFSLENVAVTAMGALLVVKGGFSVGMLVAFLAYKGQFTSRAAALADKLIEFKLLSVHLDRLADIVLTTREESGAGDSFVQPQGHRLEGQIEARNISFRYSPTDPWVIRNASFVISKGECVAITSPSGSGKTTLIKILMGLLAPTEGQVLIDDVDCNSKIGVGRRNQIAAVMQEDCLLSGTLLENIAFFDPRPNVLKIHECAKSAAIYDDIMRMPMGFNTLVGDMGAALSGGQRQRVLLARALYSDPRILFLDEATSHLDVETERLIHRELKRMSITRVMVAHRRETLQIADRIVFGQDIGASCLSEASCNGFEHRQTIGTADA